MPLTAVYTFPTVAAYQAAKAGTTPFGYTTFAQVIGDPNFEMDSKLFSAFWQDDWRADREPEAALRRPLRRLLLSGGERRTRRSRTRRSFKDDTQQLRARGSAWRGRSARRRTR